MHGPESCMFKMPDTGRYCGAVATRKTHVNEDPYGRGYWCDAHAPVLAVSIIPPDPNRDNRVPVAAAAPTPNPLLDPATLYPDLQSPKSGG